jgi:hypothetical protein
MHAHTRFLRYGTFFSSSPFGHVAAFFTLAGLVACKGRQPAPLGGPSELDAALVQAATASAEAGGASAIPPAGALVPAVAAAPVPPPRVPGAAFPPFKKTTLALDELTKSVEAAPELAKLGGDVAMFEPGDNPYLRRSKADPTTRDGYVITPLPVLWSPRDGVQLLVVTGRGKEGSFVAAWWALPEGGYRLASAFVMLGEVAPVALAFRPTERGMLGWTTCWRCDGEMGHVALRDDDTVVIVQD